MTSIPNVFRERLWVGETACLRVEEGRVDGDPALVAAHPNPHSGYDVAVVEGLDELDDRPPDGPVEVEILGRLVDGHLAARVASPTCSGPVENDREPGA